MQIDLPDVIAEVRQAFEQYEKALVSNDVATLDDMFRNDSRTIRYMRPKIYMVTKKLKPFELYVHRQASPGHSRRR